MTVANTAIGTYHRTTEFMRPVSYDLSLLESSK